MNRNELIEKLSAITGGTWVDGMGQNSVTDFVTIPEKLQEDVEIMDAIWWAVEHEIEQTLDAAAECVDADTLGENETASGIVWEKWCNCQIEADFSQIQAIIDRWENI